MKLILLLFCSCLLSVQSYKWRLKDTFDTSKVLTFSEHHMFPTHNGPPMLEQGASHVIVHVNFHVFTPINQTLAVAAAIMGLPGPQAELNLCDSNNFKANNPAVHQETHIRADTMFESEQVNEAGNHVFVWGISIDQALIVHKEGWYAVAFQMCPDLSQGSAIGSVEGSVIFKNPYGYVAGDNYGLIPFENVRMILYFLFAVFYLYRYIKNRESTLPVHKAVLVVFLISLAEATMWNAAYLTINKSGQPLCCPFPPTVIGALILQIFRQTASRTLLIIVALGYGIVRPKLMPSEWMAIAICTGLYFIAVSISKISEIIILKDVHNNGEVSKSFQIPEIFMDVLFLTWIYLALGSTIRILSEFQQTYKLAMYNRLAYTIAVFVCLFCVVNVLVLLDQKGIIDWPWQLMWLQEVLWESLNFAVICATCIICLPSESSMLLSYAAQLPTEDPDGDDDYERGLQDEDEDDFQQEEVTSSGYSKVSSASPNKGGGGVEMVDRKGGNSGSSSLSGSSSGKQANNNKGTSPNKYDKENFSSLPEADED